MEGNSQEISWTVPTHTHGPHSADWYWGLGVVAFVVTAAAIFFNNILLAVIIVIGAACLGVLGGRPPREHVVRLSKNGLSLDGTLYPYKRLNTFWVEEDAENPRLFITASGVLSPHFTLPLGNEEGADVVREYLLPYIKEEEQGPHFGEHVAALIGL